MYGYRPTSNRYSSEGVVLISHTRDTIGLIANNLEDIKLFDSVIISGGERSASPGCHDVTLPETIRLGVSKYYFFLDLSNEVAKAMEMVLKKLSAKSNIELVFEDMIGIEGLLTKHFPLVAYEINIDLPKFLNDYKTGISYDDVIDGIASPDVKNFFAMTRKNLESGANQEEYLAALKERSKLKEFYEIFFDKHRLDALIYPTTPIEAKPIEDCLDSVMMDGKYVNTFKPLTQNTTPGSYAGVPSISLPLANTSTGLPIGIQLETLESRDRVLFEIAGVVRDAVLENK